MITSKKGSVQKPRNPGIQGFSKSRIIQSRSMGPAQKTKKYCFHTNMSVPCRGNENMSCGYVASFRPVATTCPRMWYGFATPCVTVLWGGVNVSGDAWCDRAG